LEIVERFHDRAAAQAARDAFEARFQRGALPDEMPGFELDGAPAAIVALLRHCGLAASNAEALRAIAQGGVRVDGQKVEDRALELPAGEYVLQVGKRRFARLRLR